MHRWHQHGILEILEVPIFLFKTNKSIEMDAAKTQKTRYVRKIAVLQKVETNLGRARSAPHVISL